jgi:hypothetical protein
MANRKKKPQTKKKHPDNWQKDLNPDRLQGQNIGPVENSERLSAADVKDAVLALVDFNQDELKQIPLIPTGERLKQGAVYLDLRYHAPEPFTATGDYVAQEYNLFVPKAETAYEIWNRVVAAVCPREIPAEPASPDDETASSEDNPVSEEMLDKTLADSFPSSDPPSWTTGRERSGRQTK